MPPVASSELSERQIQRGILRMAGSCFRDVFIHHSPNGTLLAGTKRDRQVQGGILKGDGVKTGFPDLLCLWAPGKCALMEVKRPGERPTPAQAELHTLFEGIEVPIAVVTSQDEAYRFLIACGAPQSAEMMGAAA